MSLYRVWTVSSKSWADRTEIFPSGTSWERTYNTGAGGTTTLNLADPDVQATTQLADIYPGQRAVVVSYDGLVVYVGIIWRARYQRKTMQLTLHHKDIWSLWDRRLLSPVADQSIVDWKATWSGMNLATIIGKIVASGTDGAGRDVPIVFQPNESGSASRTYDGYNLDSVMDSMQEIMDLDNGPDVDFRPEWDGTGGVRFNLHVGDLGSRMFEVNFGASQPEGDDLWMEIDASEVATQVFGVGEGSGKKTSKSDGVLVRESQGENIARYPALQSVEQFKNTKTATQLYEQARGELLARNEPPRQVGFRIRADSPALSTDEGSGVAYLRPGNTIRWYVDDDPFLGVGWREWKVLKFSGDITSEFVTVEFQPKEGF